MRAKRRAKRKILDDILGVIGIVWIASIVWVHSFERLYIAFWCVIFGRSSQLVLFNTFFWHDFRTTMVNIEPLSCGANKDAATLMLCSKNNICTSFKVQCLRCDYANVWKGHIQWLKLHGGARHCQHNRFYVMAPAII